MKRLSVFLVLTVLVICLIFGGCANGGAPKAGDDVLELPPPDVEPPPTVVGKPQTPFGLERLIGENMDTEAELQWLAMEGDEGEPHPTVFDVTVKNDDGSIWGVFTTPVDPLMGKAEKKEVNGKFVSSPSYPVTGLSPYRTYSVSVKAIWTDNGVLSDPSDSLEFTTAKSPDTTPPGPVSDLTALTFLGVSGTTVTVNLSWSPASNGGPANQERTAMSYMVKEGATLLKTLPDINLSWQVTGLVLGTTHTYTLFSEDVAGNRSEGTSVTVAIPLPPPPPVEPRVYVVNCADDRLSYHGSISEIDPNTISGKIIWENGGGMLGTYCLLKWLDGAGKNWLILISRWQSALIDPSDRCKAGSNKEGMLNVDSWVLAAHARDANNNPVKAEWGCVEGNKLYVPTTSDCGDVLVWVFDLPFMRVNTVINLGGGTNVVGYPDYVKGKDGKVYVFTTDNIGGGKMYTIVGDIVISIIDTGVASMGADFVGDCIVAGNFYGGNLAKINPVTGEVVLADACASGSNVDVVYDADYNRVLFADRIGLLARNTLLSLESEVGTVTDVNSVCIVLIGERIIVTNRGDMNGHHGSVSVLDRSTLTKLGDIVIDHVKWPVGVVAVP